MKPQHDILLILWFLLYSCVLVPACNSDGNSESNPLADFDQETEDTDFDTIEADLDNDTFDESPPGDEDPDEESDTIEFEDEADDIEEDTFEEDETECCEEEESVDAEEYQITGICEDLTSPDNLVVCLEQIASQEDWESLTLEIQEGTQVRGTKYFLPALDDARLPPLVMNVNAILWHYEMLSDVFAQLFPDLMLEDYNTLVYAGDEREFLVGSLTEHRTTDLQTHYVFTVWDDPSRSDWVLTCDQLQDAYASLKALFALGPVEFQSYTPYQATMLLECPGIPIFVP